MKHNVKKWLCTALSVCLLLALTACGGKDDAKSGNGTSASVTGTSVQSKETEKEKDSASGSTGEETAPGEKTSSGLKAEDGVFHIKTAEDLTAFAQMVIEDETDDEFKVVLDADIDMSGVEWTPIRMEGTFDGAGHTITGLTAVGEDSQAMFHELEGELRDLTLEDVQIESTEDYAAGLVVSFTGVMENCSVSGTVKGYDGAGGIVEGLYSGSTITGCVNRAAVESGYYDDHDSKYRGSSAGIVSRLRGTSEPAVVTGCENYGTVFGLCYGAGITAQGDGKEALVSECVNYGEISSATETAGITCFAPSGTIIDKCVNRGALAGVVLEDRRTLAGITVSGIVSSTKSAVFNCANHGDIDAGGGRAFGISGSAESIVNCYTTGSISSAAASAVGHASSGASINLWDFGDGGSAAEATLEDLNKTVNDINSGNTDEYFSGTYSDAVDDLEEHPLSAWTAGADGIPKFEWEE